MARAVLAAMAVWQDSRWYVHDSGPAGHTGAHYPRLGATRCRSPVALAHTLSEGFQLYKFIINRLIPCRFDSQVEGDSPPD
jgi:hypothetical protein